MIGIVHPIVGAPRTISDASFLHDQDLPLEQAHHDPPALAQIAFSIVIVAIVVVVDTVSGIAKLVVPSMFLIDAVTVLDSVFGICVAYSHCW